MSSTANVPAPDARRFLVEVSSQLSEATIQGRSAHVNVLLKLGMMAGLHAQLDSTLNMLCSYAKQIVDFDSALVYFWNEVEEKFLTRNPYPFTGAMAQSETSENELNRWCVKYVAPFLVELGKDPTLDECLRKLNAASVLAVPLLVNNRPMGSLQFFSRRANAFSNEDAQLLWTMSRVAENLLAREQANEGLIHFAFTDHLTGLRTRGYLEQQLDVELKRSERKEEKVVLLMLDIDHFKCLNDTFGHQVGDRVLREVARILTKDMREVDTVARYGGEEFVIILPDTTEEEGLAVAQRIRKAVEKSDFTSSIREAGNALAIQKLSISIGLAVFDPTANAETKLKSKRELLEAADAALYFAKGRGRNQVVRHDQMKQYKDRKAS